jgi:hypothetical protein
MNAKHHEQFMIVKTIEDLIVTLLDEMDFGMIVRSASDECQLKKRKIGFVMQLHQQNVNELNEERKTSNRICKRKKMKRLD